MRWSRLFVSLLAAGALAHAAPPSPPAASTGWLLEYRGKSTNAFIWDARAKRLIETRVPPALSRDLLGVLGGPPGPVLIEGDRYASMSGCRQHACMEKGMLWVDTRTGAGLGAHFLSGELLLGSNGMGAGSVPAQARAAVLAWLGEEELQVESVQFIGASGSRSPLDAASYRTAGRFEAPPSGPSFDCRLARSRIERALCADAALAAQDLALHTLYRGIRGGHDTVGAREELRGFQREWIRQRDRECLAAPDLAACLTKQYAAQHERLRHWLPAR